MTMTVEVNMTLRELERVDTRDAQWDATRKALSYTLGNRAVGGFLRYELALLSIALERTRWDRRKKRISRRIDQIRDSLRNMRSSEVWSMEQRAKRQEDREEWAEQGWRVFDTRDSSVFSTQPFPLEYAGSSARRDMEILAGFGVETKSVIPDLRHYRIAGVRGSGGHGSGGHVVILVKADTAMEVELIRRRFTAYMEEYWRGVYAKHTLGEVPAYFNTGRFGEWR